MTLGDNPNYEVTTTAGTFTITKATATVTITGNTGSKTYNGREQSVTGYTVGIPSGVNIQQSEISTTATATAKGTNVGTYTMGLTAAAFGTTNGNYDVTFQVTDGSITINRADATVTADNKTKVAGELDPSFTATVTGLQNGETASVLTYTFSRETGEGVGTYAIKPAGDAQQGNYNVTYVNGTLTITEPACPTMGTTTYTPNPVTGSATSITFTTPLINMASGVTVSDASFTVVSDGVANQTLNATYSNGAITAALSGLDNYRDKLIKVTPKVTVSGCSNPGSITGDVVEICVQPTLPTYTVAYTSGTGKTSLFKRDGNVYLYFNTITDPNNLIKERGFYMSYNQSEVTNHSCTPVVASYESINLKEYQGTNYTGSDYQDKWYVSADLTHCGKKTYYRPYIIVSLCGHDTTIYGTAGSFEMWGPEGENSSTFKPWITEAPTAPVTSGSTVTLTQEAWMRTSIGNRTIPQWFSQYSWGLSIVGLSGVSSNDFTYRWTKTENGVETQIYSSHTNGSTTVSPTQTTTYTAYSELVYKNKTCSVSKSITVTVQ